MLMAQILFLAAAVLQPYESISEVPISFRIHENVPKDYTVGHLASNDETYPHDVSYKLGVDSDLFHIDDKAKSIFTKVPIDAEEICENEAVFSQGNSVVIDCDNELKLSFNVNVFDASGNMFKVLKITVTIVDEDDQSPQFEKKLLEVGVTEVLTIANHMIDLLQAVDKDINEANRYLCYILRDHQLVTFEENDYFRLTIEDGLPRLMVLKALDTETVEKFSLELLAIKSGAEMNQEICNGDIKGSSKPAILSVIINVLDLNDNWPVFETYDAQVEISEDTKPPKKIYNMVAHDADHTSVLKYSLLDKKKILKNIFEVQSDGSVHLIGPLDYEQNKAYDLEIQVSDGAHKVKNLLHVKVLDVNDEKPTFKLNPAELKVPENDLHGKALGQVEIIDRDSSTVNGQVFCYEPGNLRNQQPLQFSPDPHHSPKIGKYSLHSRQSFDRENIPDSQLTARLICKDGNENSLNNVRHTSTLSITLTVTDVNDWPPEFNVEGDQLVVDLPENNQIGDIVTKVTASDRDLGPNAEIHYSLSDTTDFQIDSITGTLTAARVFDRESLDTYKLLLTARDQGEPKLSSTLSVIVKISDRNDNSPTLLPCQSLTLQSSEPLRPYHHMNEFRRFNSFRVKENKPPDTFVGHALAIDTDGEDNSRLTYEFIGSEPTVEGRRQFKLMANGSIFTREVLNREEKASYNLLIRVSDNAPNEPRSTNGRICIDVEDENDNAPIFKKNEFLIPLDELSLLKDAQNDQGLQMTRRPAFLVLSIHEKIGFQLLRIEAFDTDYLDNSLISYSLSPIKTRRGLGDFLDIDTSSGIIRTKRLLRANDQGRYLFNVTARDSGVPQLDAQMGLMVNLEDIPARGIDHIFSEGVSKYIADVPEISWWNDSRNLLVVMILGSVSAVLAIVLITAVICMLRPCIRRYQSQCNLNGQEPLITGYRMANTQQGSIRGGRQTWYMNSEPNQKDLNYDLNELSSRNQAMMGLMNRQNTNLDSNLDLGRDPYGNIISIPKFEPITDNITNQPI